MRSLLLGALFLSAATHSAHADDKSDKLPMDAPTPLTTPFDAVQAKAAQDA
jgi:hypothetical protein